MTVRILADHVINCIAAGEVIDRPAAVVRELLDNAIDAGADDICITLESGGHSLIKVSDNGCGMSREDLLLAFERHATSKLKQVEDLDGIATMGFRGEALAAIAAVSKVTMRTRLASEQVGQQLLLEAGKVIDVSAVACNCGTEVEVRNIYYNTPARRKFLRKPRSEEQRIKSWISQTALVRPGTRYRLISDGRELINLPARESSLERARQYFRGTAIEIEDELAEIEIIGLVAHPALAQADSSSLLIFVNQRLINDRMLIRAVREGFEHTLKDREYPVGFISLAVPPDQVDVNVHPQKSEVRFRDSQQLFNSIRRSVGSAVRQFKGPVDVSTRAVVDYATQIPYPSGSTGNQQPFIQEGLGNYGSGDSQHSILVNQDRPSCLSESEFKFSDLNYIGQLFECYLLCQLEERFFLIDMHAAHERINYNRINLLRHQREIPTQKLLLPIVVELSEEGLMNCLEHQEVFKQFGFDLEQFGGNSLAVRSVPDMISADSVQQLVREIAAIWEEGTAHGRFEQEFEQIAARIACHSSVRSGKRLEQQEVRALFASLDLVDFSSACPHGRPILVKFSKAEVEKWFGRDR